jgi:hypothetical protein
MEIGITLLLLMGASRKRERRLYRKPKQRIEQCSVS